MIELDLKKIAPQYKGGHVAIVGQGPSMVGSDFSDKMEKFGDKDVIRPTDMECLTTIEHHVRQLDYDKYPDRKFWTLNGGWGYHKKSVLGFHMDEMKLIDNDKRHSTVYLEAYKNQFIHAKIPIVTSKPDPRYPTMIGYPLEEVLEFFGYCYFAETVEYMIALAVMWGVKILDIYGCDYYNNERFPGERCCAEAWLRAAKHYGVDVRIQPDSSLLKLTHRSDCHPNLYGYHLDHALDYDLLNAAIEKGRNRIRDKWAS